MTFLEKLLGVPPSDEGNTQQTQPPVTHHDIKEISDVPQLEMTFQQAQKAGFQFCYVKGVGEPVVSITKIYVKSEQVIIPAKINGYRVMFVGGRTQVKRGVGEFKLYFPNTVRFIGERAFLDSRGLTEVFFPEGTVTIGEYAFCWIVSLKKLHFGKCTDIEDFAFGSCRYLENVELQECRLGKCAFHDCKNLRSIKWTKLDYCGGGEVFYSTPLEKVKEVLILGRVFQKYNGNDKVYVVPDGITTIGGNAFAWCETLEKVVLPRSVDTIESTAFAFCRNLREINLENVDDIHDYAFKGCPLNDDIQFSKNVTFHGNPFGHYLFNNNPEIIGYGDRHTTPDGIVVNGTLMTMGRNFVDGVWTLSEGIRRISCKRQESGTFWEDVYKTVILPKSMEHIVSLECFKGAQRIVVRNGRMRIGSSEDICGYYRCKGHFTLCFETESGLSEFVFHYPKWKKDNPDYDAVVELYKDFFKSINWSGICDYDERVLNVGLSWRHKLDIAYRRLVGGYMLSDENRKRYMDFVRTHRKKGLRYATAEKNEQKIEFFKALFVEE